MKAPTQPAVVVTADTHRPISEVDRVDAGSDRGQQPGPSLAELELLARWMDSVFRIPGTELRFGFDAILGLIPGLGDTATSLVSLYILQEARKRGVSRLTMVRMGANIVVDYVLGSIPFFGDIFDVYWKANLMNVELLRQHSLANSAVQRRLKISDWLFLAGLAGLLIALLVVSLTLTYFVIRWVGTHVFA
ncbi:MAG: hypothetical protein JWM11_7905 [Planctomycetaceae bacterium]|nr:hypothetical protein [Planctomycetaceae bacterium]